MDNKHKYINVVYQLYAIDEDGKKHLMEKVEEDRPFFFISGFGTTLDAFEKYIEKLDTNEEFDFHPLTCSVLPRCIVASSV